MKVCKLPDCVYAGKFQPIENFHKQKHNKDGRDGTCRHCRSKYWKRKYKENPQRFKTANRKLLCKRFDITEEEYQNLLAQQNGVCAICQRLPVDRQLDLDHDHKTGRARGFLCRSCNVSLGHFADNIVWLNKAVKYLNKSIDKKGQ